eukprot:TRINITY_DN22917_c0_g1_i1.p1 TRINITY_DN22917_c0_g1~~TRINITY_DN22917_c0_g1_i1.p1  ORF type:complete len:235 (-),score=2.70 TRINITY_DN22917_c0_g1_i1:668-1372(-)
MSAYRCHTSVVDLHPDALIVKSQIRSVCCSFKATTIRNNGYYSIPLLQSAQRRRLLVSRAALQGNQTEESTALSAKLDRRVSKLIRVLKEDLPRQYEADLDWSIYADSVIFVDPTTKLKGQLLYRGMLATLRVLSTTLFAGGAPNFELYSIEEVDVGAGLTSAFPSRPVGPLPSTPVRAIRTTWSTRARSLWGTELFISGDDIFRVGSDGMILTHESAWNEEPSSIWDKLRPRF